MACRAKSWRYCGWFSHAPDALCPAGGEIMSHDGNTNPGVHSGSGQASAGKEWEPESTVLVVNDAPAQVELMRLQLHQSGYRVLTAVDGEEAFEVARSARPDLIISDVVMPGVDGIELCRLIRAHPDLHATPVLLVSAVRTDSESVVEGLKAGADDYLEVPYDPLRLILKVAQIIERKRVEEALRDAEQRLQHIVASSPAVLFTLRSEDGTFQGINWISENIEAILGYRADETLGADWWMSNIHPEDRDAVVSQFHTDIFRQDYFTAEYRFRHKEDQYRWILGESRLLRDAAGQPTEIVGSLSDITERKRLEDQFQQAQKMQAIGHLAGGGCSRLQQPADGYLRVEQHPPGGITAERPYAGDGYGDPTSGGAGRRVHTATSRLLPSDDAGTEGV